MATSITGPRREAWVCHKCHTANPNGAHFCQTCGETIGRDCPRCSMPIETVAEFCPFCGANVAEALALAPRQKEIPKIVRPLFGSLVFIGLALLCGLILSNTWWGGLTSDLVRSGREIFGYPIICCTVLADALAFIGIIRGRRFLRLPAVPGDDQLRAIVRKGSRLAIAWLILSVAVLIGVIFMLSTLPPPSRLN